MLVSLLKRSILEVGVVLMHEFLDDEMSRLQVDIPEDLKSQAKIEAIRQGKTLSELVEAALKLYLEQGVKGKK